jgi:uncharacterized protein (DUF58 family)
MVWRKSIFGRNTLESVSFMAGVFLFFSFYIENYVLIFLGSFLIVLCRMSLYYLNHVDDQLVFENDKETIRLSVEDEGILKLKLSQFSSLPIFRGTLKLTLEPIVEGIDIPSYSSDTNIEFTVPFHLKGKKTIQISLPIKAIRRGTTRIKSLDIIIENFFGFGFVELKYNPFIHKEIIIHPIPVTVPHSERLIATKSQGEYPAPSSMFEHILAPIGTRDYVYTDSFQRINWKATAKTQTLQTKVFERTAHYSWTFIINLRIPHMPSYHLGVVENIEEIASNVAYMAQFATKKGIDFEVFLNLRMASDVSVYHLPKGGGRKQLGKLFDALSRINRNGNTLPINRLFHYVEKHQQNSPVVIYCGPFEEEGLPYFSKWQKKGQNVFLLHDDKEFPAIVPYGRI